MVYAHYPHKTQHNKYFPNLFEDNWNYFGFDFPLFEQLFLLVLGKYFSI